MEKNSKRIRTCEFVLCILLLGAIVHVGYLNFEALTYDLNSDHVNEISYLQASWEQKTLWPEGFFMCNESISTRPVLLYWLFYGITNNFLLSFQLENLCTLLLELIIIYWLLKKLSIKRVIRLLCLFLFVVFLPRPAREFNFYPSNGHIMYAIFILISLALRILLREVLQSENNTNRKWKIIAIISCIFSISVAIGYGTIRVLMWFYCPVLFLDLLILLINYMKHTPISKIDCYFALISVCSCFLNVIAYGVFCKLHGSTFNVPGFYIVEERKWLNWDVLSEQFLSILYCFTGITEPGLLNSTQGLLFVFRCGIAVLEILCVIWLLSRGLNRRNDLVWYWLIETVLMAGFQIVTGVAGEQMRYYSVTAIFLPLLCSQAINEWIVRNDGKIDLWPCTVILLCVLGFEGLNIKTDMLRYSAPPPILTQVAEYIENNGYKYVSASYWNAGVIKAYTNGAVEALHSGGLGITTLTPHYWMIDSNLYSEERIGEPNILLLTDEEEQVVEEDDNQVNIILKNYAEKVEEIGEYNLYALSENPYTLVNKMDNLMAGLPSKNQTYKIDFPNKKGFQFANATINSNSELVSDGTGGCILWGPYSQSVEGIYDITLHYTVDSFSDSNSGIFDVALNAEQKAATEFNADAQSATISGVELTGGEAFEARVYIPEGMIIRIQSIEYQRKT